MWFLYKLKRISDMHAILKEYKLDTLPGSTLLQAKKSGFSDEQIGRRISASEVTDGVMPPITLITLITFIMKIGRAHV